MWQTGGSTPKTEMKSARVSMGEDNRCNDRADNSLNSDETAC